MRRSVRGAVLVAGLAAASLPASEAWPGALSDLADQLQRIQARVAAGDKGAYADELKQLKAMGAEIAAAKTGVWSDRREVDSLVLYVLSGGALTDVVSLLKGDAVVASERQLLRGSVAYITNNEADALEALGALDVNAVDLRVAGPIAFALSVLKTKRDPKAATSLLDWARLVAPGSLVEEAALRREIALVAESGDAPGVAMLTRQYATRFGASPYAADFFRELAHAIARFGLADETGNFQLLAEATSSLPPEERRDFLLTLAKAAVVKARFAAAAAAGAEALRGAAAGSQDEARARLYLDAGQLLSDKHDAARADLQNLAAARLDRSDAALLAAIRTIAGQLRTMPDAGAVEAQDETSAPKAEAARTMEIAEEALKRTEPMLSGGEGAAP